MAKYQFTTYSYSFGTLENTSVQSGFSLAAEVRCVNVEMYQIQVLVIEIEASPLQCHLIILTHPMFLASFLITTVAH